jgi:hypothetical protein
MLTALLVLPVILLPYSMPQDCPAGWVSNGSYCIKMTTTAPDILPNYGRTPCPPPTYSNGTSCLIPQTVPKKDR